MVQISVTQLVKNFIELGSSIELPPCRETISVLGRIESFCSSTQMDKILEINPFPSEIIKNPTRTNIAGLRAWQERFDELKRKGIGRERLVAKLPDYKSPETIPKKLHNLYEKEPVDAGIYAQKYLAYNPFISFHNLWDRPLEEPIEQIVINNTNNKIVFQYDLLDLDGLYEFKLTKREYLERRLKEALIQLFIYDFMRRLKFNVRQYFSLLIEILCIDEDKIYCYGNLFSNDSIQVDKEVLKAVFRQSRLENLDKVTHIIDDIYDHLEPRLRYDFNRDMDKLLKRDTNPDNY